jgi:hypothetical protein
VNIRTKARHGRITAVRFIAYTPFINDQTLNQRRLQELDHFVTTQHKPNKIRLLCVTQVIEKRFIIFRTGYSHFKKTAYTL